MNAMKTKVKAFAVVLRNYPDRVLVSYDTEHIDVFKERQTALEYIDVIDSEGNDAEDFKVIPCTITLERKGAKHG